MKLYPHQSKGMEYFLKHKNAGVFWDMGLGKTYIGSELIDQWGEGQNIVCCQKTKISDWIDHFRKNYPHISVYDGTKPKQLEKYLADAGRKVLVINYDIIFRRENLLALKYGTAVYDESSLLSNDKASRTKACMKIKAAHKVLLSGTPSRGKYELLWTQAKMLGWDIGKTKFWDEYILYYMKSDRGNLHREIIGYKNVNTLVSNLCEHGANFLLADEVLHLPEQTWIDVPVKPTKEYTQFEKSKYVMLPGGTEIIGDTPLNKLIGCRKLCGVYNPYKLAKYKDLLDSTAGRVIVFYNFDAELEALKAASAGRPISEVNGHAKDLTAYENASDSVTLVQYQAGALGLNLQLANTTIYYTPPTSAELWIQSPKRTHRIGQNHPCFYYTMRVDGSREDEIYNAIKQGKDYTLALFEIAGGFDDGG